MISAGAVLKLPETMKATLLPPRNPALCAPLTSNRELAACLIANVPMVDLLAAELTRAGFELVAPEDACPRTLRIPIDNWIEIGALVILARNPDPARLSDPDGTVLAWKGHDAAEECPANIVTSAGCFPVNYPWDLLRMNEEVLALMDESSILGEVSPLATLQGVVRIAQGARILPGTVIEGPALIGPNTQVGPNAYIRGATSIGANCFIGNGAEVKNSIIYNNTTVSRQCYVGDSILGSHVILGAGTCTENHRHDGRNHVAVVAGTPIETGRQKLGVIAGDGVRTGVNTSIDPAIRIGIARTTIPGSYVAEDLL